MSKKIIYGFFFYCAVFLSGIKLHAQSSVIGMFDDQNDIGKVKHAGSGTYDSASQEYHLSGSGTNIWENFTLVFGV